MTPWGDRAVSPCVFTPGAADAGAMSLNQGLSLEDGRLGPLVGWLYFRIKFNSGASSNLNIDLIELYDSSGRFSPTSMSGPTTGGFTVSTSGDYAAQYAGWEAFNIGGLFWATQPVGVPGSWIKILCPQKRKIIKYAITPSNAAAYPTSWDFEASDTGAFSGEQTLLHTVSSNPWGGVYSRKEFVL